MTHETGQRGERNETGGGVRLRDVAMAVSLAAAFTCDVVMVAI
jgi:hypothetical protein